MAYYPGKKVEHKGPSSISFVKVLIVVALAAGVYFCITFVPPWWRYYKASSLMLEEGQGAYSKRREQQSWEHVRAKVHAQVRAELVAMLKIPPTALHVSVEKRDGNVHVSASWTTVARWPLVGKTTPMRFKESVHFAAR